MYVVRSTCRGCDSADLEIVLSMGDLPLPDALLAASDLEKPERRYPLDVAVCRVCALMQIIETVSPSELYDESYRHFASSSDAYVEHTRALATQLVQERHLDGNSFVVEIGSNDGYLLKAFQARGVAVLGIEPAPEPAAAARRAGIATLPTFFTKDLANHLAAEGRRADVVIANQVIDHVPDLHGFLAGLRTLLKENGVAVITCPYVRDLVEAGSFDVIYHEHLCYFSVTSLARVLESAGLSLNQVEHQDVHGGSLQLFVSRERHVQPSVQQFLAVEAELGMGGIEYYSGLGRRAEMTRLLLLGLLSEVKADGKSIVGYGAAAKGSTMLNYCGIDDTYLDYIVDRNSSKHGRFMPGVRLPILAADRLVSNRPDYVLLLAWNFREEVLRQQRAYCDLGGRFIVPVPEPAII